MTTLLASLRALSLDLTRASELATEKRCRDYILNARSWIHAAMKVAESGVDKQDVILKSDEEP